MIHIIIVDNNSTLFDSITDSLQATGYTVTSQLGHSERGRAFSSTASDWVDFVDGHQLNVAIHTVVQKSNTIHEIQCSQELRQNWILNASKLELLTPTGLAIRLSHNECCVLLAAARAQGNVVSRKLLIEALGYNYWHYDERCLETLISRLRKKLSLCTEGRFSIQSVKKCGYLFGIEALEILG